MAKIVKTEAGWMVEGRTETYRTRELARAGARHAVKVASFCAELESALRADGTIPADVVVNTTRPALPFAPSRYVGRTALGLVLDSERPFDAFMGRPALGPGRCYN